ncbi:MAG: undecaprenyl/decaprenyl-phosphate alpha-N-acetylglucosaminyl 1-phosphate transferase [Solirubrobacterales bacterium]|nr:undecaprenyl/decaprenyl-phosphate alpha-N-acetylglucosaminyl 1-phosphate transferase [Solirubrobacterales bacterium]
MSFTDSVDALMSEGAVLWGFLCAGAIVVVLTPLVGRLAPRIGGLDHGGDRPRVHASPIPRIGGIAIVLGILVPAIVLLDLNDRYRSILIGTALIAAIGLIDDIRGLSPRTKLLAVIVIALIPVIGSGLRFNHITLPLIGDHDIGWVGYPLTVLWIALLANLINLIDGMDSLAAGIVAIASASFALLAASFGRADTAVLSAIVCGATVAFLWHNYHPAKIFMGDSGALALGFLLATVSVQGVLKTAATIALVAPLLVIAVPILDTSFVVLKRLKYRRAPWGADHNHFYHRFMRIGYSQRRTAAYMHLWAGLVTAYALLLRFIPPRPGGEVDISNTLIAGAAGVVVLATTVWMVYTLEIIKARHLRALGLGRFAPTVDGGPERAEDEEEALERALTAHR